MPLPDEAVPMVSTTANYGYRAHNTLVLHNGRVVKTCITKLGARFAAWRFSRAA